MKPRPDHGLREIKRDLWLAGSYDTLILGNSRAEVGFDPANRAVSAAGLSAFNMALPGTDLSESVASLEFSAHKARPRVLIVGLEFLDFLVDPSAEPSEPSISVEESQLEYFTRGFKAVFTVRAAVDSTKAILAQRDRNAAILLPNGFNPLREYAQIARIDGYWALFQQKAVESAATYLRKPHSIKLHTGRPAPGFYDLQRLLRGAPAQTHLVIYPYHAQILMLFEETGLWPAFEEWKRSLVHVIEHSALAPEQQVILWDFSGITDLSTELIPAPDDRLTEARWYWEGGHFKSALGDVVLGQVFGGQGIGVRLTSANVENHIEALRDGMAAFRTANPVLEREVRKIADGARKSRELRAPGK